MKNKWWDGLIVTVLVVGLIVRLWRIDTPLADWHSWRQADTAGVTREYVKHGIDLLHPTYMDISSIPSGLDNPRGFRMVEFPFVNGLAAGMIQAAESAGLSDDLVVWERLVSILFSMGTILILYLLAAKMIDKETAIIAAAVMALMPFNIYYSRAVLPEPKLVFFSLAAVYFLVNFIENWSWSSWVPGVVSAALATLLKPLWLVIYGPGLIWWVWIKRRRELGKIKWGFMLILAAALTVLPFLVWRAWISQYPEGIPAYDWLFNAGGIRLRPAWFRWLFADRLGRLILGYWGLILFGVGLAAAPKKNEHWFFYAWLAGGLGDLIWIAAGNVTHDYYQAILVPTIAVFVARGVRLLWRNPGKVFSKPISRLLVLLTCGLSLAFSWFYIRDYFNINHPEIVEAGQAADKILPDGALVVAPYNGDTAFLFQTGRWGWPVGGDLDSKINRGATHLVSVVFDEETMDLMERCNVMVRTDRYVILELNDCREGKSRQ